ncbi:hypothetical protein KKA15_01190 [Patescibacteria group bacterium]|nr:hypothetical protein [Patescibacteria group bacterium]
MNKKNTIIISVIIIIIVAGALFFLKVNKENVNESAYDYSELIVFEVKNQDLNQYEQDKAFNDFLVVREKLNSNPDFFDGWLELGTIHRKIGNYELAEKTWIYAGQLRPKNSPSFNNLGNLYANYIVDYDRSIANYLIAIENSEQDVFHPLYARSLWEIYFYHLKDYDKAEEFMKGRLEKHAENTEYLSLLAYVYVTTDRSEEAYDLYGKILEIDPSDEEVKRAYNALKIELGK